MHEKRRNSRIATIRKSEENHFNKGILYNISIIKAKFT